MLKYLSRSLAGVSLALSLLLSGPITARAETPVVEAEYSKAERTEVFERVWATIDAKYYDPKFNGVDWKGVSTRYRPLIEGAQSDDEFFRLLKKMVGELKDAHTRVLTPVERDRWENFKATSIGIQAFEVEKKPAVVKVEKDSAAEKAGVRSGMIVLSVDGKSVDRVFADARSLANGTSSERAALLRLYGSLFAGEPGTLATVALRSDDGRELTVKLERQVVTTRPRTAYSKLPSGLGYIEVTAWENIDAGFKDALEKLQSSPGIIVDLRGNRGGRVAQVLRCAEFLMPARTDFGHFVSRSGKELQMTTAPGGKQIYSGHVVILVDEASASGSELFAGVLHEAGRASVIGRQSCGCLLAITNRRKLKGGIGLHVSELGYVSPKGRVIEGEGVKPDTIIAPTLESLREGDDLVFQAAQRMLLEKASKGHEQVGE